MSPLWGFDIDSRADNNRELTPRLHDVATSWLTERMPDCLEPLIARHAVRPEFFQRAEIVAGEQAVVYSCYVA